ncbi:MAG: ROK family protein [Candidatus Dormibacteria bacterium]
MAPVPARRPPRPSVYAGVDVGATKIEAVVTGADLAPAGGARVPTPLRGGPRAVVEALAAAVDEALASSPLRRLGAIGVGVPGEVDPDEGTVAKSPNIAGWTAAFPFRDEVEKRLGVVAAVDNDVRTALLGEYRLGAAAPFGSVLAVWFGTGVGGAILLDGTIRRGRLGAAGEIGHAVAVPDGRRCSCGRRGCLEAYAGRASMERRARERADKGEKTVLFTLIKKANRTRLTSGVIARALDQGDQLAHELINEAVHAAGPVLASAVNVLDVDAVLIGGGLGSRLGQPFARRLQRAMAPHLLHDGREAVTVVPAGLGDLSGALGGVALAVARRQQR